MIAGLKVEKTALVAGAVGLALSAAMGVVSGGGVFPSYLVGALFWIQISFGCLGLQMLHALSGGGWGKLISEPLASASSSMPVCALLFAPTLLGLGYLYPWAHPEVVAADELLRHKAAFLNVPFFVARAVFYFALWSILELLLFQRARRRPGETNRRLRTIAGPGILASGLTMTFASIDWIMTLDPHWYSTLLGLLVIVGSLLGAMAFCIVLVTSVLPEDEIPVQQLHDVGNLLLVFTMLWAYLSFSQYLIIYSGNMAEDVTFYVHRTEGGFQHIALGLIVLHFAVPFIVLLSRRTKRNPRSLRAVALGILFMRLVELFWFVAPNFRHTLGVAVADVLAPLGVGGVWLYWFSRRLRAFAAGRAASPAPALPEQG